MLNAWVFEISTQKDTNHFASPLSNGNSVLYVSNEQTPLRACSTERPFMLRRQHAFLWTCAALGMLIQPSFGDTSTSTTATAAIPSRGDALASGDKIKLKVDAPIFQYDKRLPAPTTKTKGLARQPGRYWRSSRLL